MKNLKFNIQTSKQEYWTDENGMRVPYKRTSKAERLAERRSGKAIKEALKLNRLLGEFKRYLTEASREVYEAFLKENGIKNPGKKGNYTWYNFDRSIKIEVDAREAIEFDEILISAAREKFLDFIDRNVTAKNEFIKELILQAFETRKGKLDVKKILTLTRYEAKVGNPTFSEAVRLINKAIRRRPTKMYFRIWVKNEEGKYQSVDLNFSSIEFQNPSK